MGVRVLCGRQQKRDVSVFIQLRVGDCWTVRVMAVQQTPITPIFKLCDKLPDGDLQQIILF